MLSLYPYTPQAMHSQAHEYNPPPHTGLEIYYQDAFLLALNKPSGLLSVPGRGEHKQDSLATRVQLEYPEALPVHRLDMATSGLMLMARNGAIQRRLGLLFEQRRIKKRYIAIVNGKLEHERGEIKLPLIADWSRRPLQRVDHEIGKPAVTTYKLMQYHSENDTTRIELIPETGRTHQLRVHMQAIGHAIVGDRLYATEEVQKKAARLLLHAEMLAFIHPLNGREIEINSEVPF